MFSVTFLLHSLCSVPIGELTHVGKIKAGTLDTEFIPDLRQRLVKINAADAKSDFKLDINIQS